MAWPPTPEVSQKSYALCEEAVTRYLASITEHAFYVAVLQGDYLTAGRYRMKYRGEIRANRHRDDRSALVTERAAAGGGASI